MNKQTHAWQSEFGVEYTNRNPMTMQDMDALYIRKYGVSRTDINLLFLGSLNRNIKVLEVGSNVGVQLAFLQAMGFMNLYGIDVSYYAVELSKSRTRDINIVWGNALDIPFKDGFFDLVFTSGLLIHINPDDICVALKEIYRCSNRYIWGGEYFAEEYTQIKYREAKETSDLLWKANFPKIFCEQFKDLKVVKSKLFEYVDEGNKDIYYLLEKEKK